MCSPGQLRSTAVSEINGILTHFAPVTNILPPWDSKTAVGYFEISINCAVLISGVFSTHVLFFQNLISLSIAMSDFLCKN